VFHADSREALSTEFQPEVMPMSKPRSPDAFQQPTRTDAEEPTSQANPLHDERGPMSNEHDPRTAVNHLTGGPMTKIARPTANPDQPHGARMPTTDSSAEALNTNGESMTETRTHQATPDNPNPKGPMPPDLPPDDEPIPDTKRMITYEDAARASLRTRTLELGLDEVLVLDRLAERLRRGQRQYGFLHLANDRRAFRSKEAREELEDALVYLACAWLKAETREVA
jgi:hypothetical protein